MLIDLIYMKCGYIKACILIADYNRTCFIYTASTITTILIVTVYTVLKDRLKLTVSPMCLLLFSSLYIYSV